MQHTEKRNFNIIETSDPFSPEALNENTRKVEAALDTVAAHADAGDAALSQRVTVLEGHKLAVGSYTGDGAEERTIQLGFTPVLVLVMSSINSVYLLHKDNMFGTGMFGEEPVLKIVEGGFLVSNRHLSFMYNGENTKYSFAAFK